MKTLKAKLSAKLNKQGGFTLVEMLIVVAIIAILIAISIPLVNKALEKARDATDDANFRSAIALGNIELLTEDDPNGTYWYFISNSDNVGGYLVKAASATTKPTDTNGTIYESQCTGASHGATGTSAEKSIKITIDNSVTDAAGAVTAAWADVPTT